MLTPFSDAAVKKYAPAVQPKKQLAPGEDPDAPQPIKPLGAPPQPSDDMKPLQLGTAAQNVGQGAANLIGQLGAAGLQRAPDADTGGKSMDEVLAIQRQEAERNRNLNDQQEGFAPTGAPSDFAPVLQGAGALGAPPVADVPPPAGSNPIALGDPNAPAPTAGATPAKPEPTATAPPGEVLTPAQFAPTIDLGKANQDAPEPSKPGYVWHHDGHGWNLTPAGATGAAGTAGAAGGATAPLSLEDTLNKKMMDVMNQNAVPTRDDPAIAAALAANRLAGQRGTERNRAMLAERMAREGGGADSGAMRTALMGLNESRAASEGQYAADTILQETKQRRDQLQNVLALAGNTLDAKEKNRIQEQLGRLNAEVQRYGISEGGRQADQSLAEQIRQSGLDEAFRRAGLDSSNAQAGASRSESARQFDINQAQQQAQWEYEANRQQLLDMFGLMGY